MGIFLKLAFLFLIGSTIGWVLELIYRRIISSKKWINPGFLIGPYLPIYGFGLCIFYLFSQLSLNGILIIFIMMISITCVEYIAGLIFIKGMGVKLWDYSENLGNINGLICPLYMCIWGILASIYYYIINPYIVKILLWFDNNLYFSFFIGFFFGIMVIDIAYSTQIVVKIRKLAKEKGLIVKYEEFKASIARQAIKNKEKYSFIFALGNNLKAIEEHLNEYMSEQIKRTNKIKRKVNLFIKRKRIVGKKYKREDKKGNT